MRVKNKKKIYRCVWYAIAIFCLTLVCALFAPQSHAVLAEGDVEADVEADVIYIGDVINAEDYALSHEGNTVKAEGLKAVYPNGGVYGGDSFIVETAGAYEVTYYATVNGSYIEGTKRYTAIRQPKDMISSQDGAIVSYGKYEIESPYEIKSEIYGALVTFKAGTSIVFKNTIPTEKLTETYNILDMIVMPETFKETDFERLTVQVSDADNPDNFVEIIIDSSNMLDGDGQVSYVKAGANGQIAGGYEGSKYHTSNYGTQVEHSFRAFGHTGEFRYNHTVSEHSLTIAIDNESKKVYCGPTSNMNKENLLVNDLDDVTRYKGNLWGGFTSDEVVVKVTAGMFAKSTGKVIIKSFGDYDFSKDIEDTDAPKITLLYDENATLPVATVGKQFSFIPFVAKDALDEQVKTNVYVYYTDANGRKLNVSSDGLGFEPKRVGEYEVVYTAEDYSGNKSERSIVINAVAANPDIFIALDESEIFAKVYQTVAIKEASEIYVFGGNGDLRVERTVYSPAGYILDVKDSLLLTDLGDYKVVYKVTDYLQNVQYSVVTVHAGELAKPIFVETPSFEKVFIQGFQYELPQPFVVETIDGKVQTVPYKVYVNDVLADGSFTAEGTSVAIKYVAEGTESDAEWSQIISVVDTENGKYRSKYFYTEGGVSVTDEKDYLAVTFKETSVVEFIKKLYSSGFSLAFYYEQENMNVNTMSIVLTDAADKNLQVTFRFSYDVTENIWFLQLNGKGEKLSFVVSKNNVGFSLSADGFGVLDTSGVSLGNIQYYDNGELFNGFSDAVYFRMEFDDVAGDSSIYMTKLCNQTLGYQKSDISKAKDEIKPVIFLKEEFQIRQKLGTQAHIPTAVAFDVLGQISEFTVKVEKTATGEVLAYGSATEPVNVTLNSAGNYLVRYYAKDSNGKHEESSYLIFVADETAPTLRVDGKLKSEYKVGSKISIPKYSATDNGDKCYIQVELILPNNEVRLLHYSENGTVTSMLSSDNKLYNSSFKADENTFVVEETGTYTLRFLAYDEYYNCTVHEITFNVK